MNKEEILKQIDELKRQVELLDKPKFEVGKWYEAEVYGGDKWLINIVSISGNSIEQYYGFKNNIWKDNIGKQTVWGSTDDNVYFKPAIESEVFEALKKEAIKRGFKSGITIKRDWIKHDEIRNIHHGDNWFYGTSSNFLQLNGNILFENGKWAEIIDEPILIGGYEVKKESDEHNTTFLYKIGCKTFKHSEILGIKIMMTNKGFNKVSFDGIETDLKTIIKILNL